MLLESWFMGRGARIYHLSGWLEYNGAIINVIDYTGAFPTITSQNVCKKKKVSYCVELVV